MTNNSSAISDSADLDKVSEYFKLKKSASNIRKDLKDLKIQHSNYDESEKLAKKLKELRDEIKEEESIKAMIEKLSQIKERLDLLKELIRIDLIENSLEETSKGDDDKKLKLIYILKEVKAREDGKKKTI